MARFCPSRPSIGASQAWAKSDPKQSIRQPTQPQVPWTRLQTLSVLAWISTEPDLPNMALGQTAHFRVLSLEIIMRNGALIAQLPNVSWYIDLTIQANSEAISTKKC